MSIGQLGNMGQIGANIFSTQRSKFGDNPFLQLLITQMRSQTPLEPVDNASFMQQMSQFSSMEQQKELNDNLLNLLQFQGALARLSGLTQGAAMIGHEVEYVDAKGKTKTGIVESVHVDEEGSVSVRIGKSNVPLGGVIGIKAAPEGGGEGNEKNNNPSGNKKGS